MVIEIFVEQYFVSVTKVWNEMKNLTLLMMKRRQLRQMIVMRNAKMNLIR